MLTIPLEDRVKMHQPCRSAVASLLEGHEVRWAGAGRTGHREWEDRVFILGGLVKVLRAIGWEISDGDGKLKPSRQVRLSLRYLACDLATMAKDAGDRTEDERATEAEELGVVRKWADAVEEALGDADETSATPPCCDELQAAKRLAQAHREVAAQLPEESPTRALALRCANQWTRLAGPSPTITREDPPETDVLSTAAVAVDRAKDDARLPRHAQVALRTAAELLEHFLARAETSTTVDTFDPPRSERTARELAPLRSKPAQLSGQHQEEPTQQEDGLDSELELEAESVQVVRSRAEEFAEKLPSSSWWKGYWQRLASALKADEERLGLTVFGNASRREPEDSKRVISHHIVGAFKEMLEEMDNAVTDLHKLGVEMEEAGDSRFERLDAIAARFDNSQARWLESLQRAEELAGGGS